MKISIITITYNAEKWLEGTMLSILNQNNSDFEYLIIDGKSTDNTVNIIKQYEQKIIQNEFPSFSINNLHWISEKDHGLYDAMNKGLRMAKGEYVWFINAGDKVYDETTVNTIIDVVHQHPCCDVVYGQSLIIDENDTPLGERHKIAPPILTKKSLLNGLVVCHQSILVRTSIAPLYNLKYKLTADYDWVCNILSISKENRYIDQYLSKFMTSGISAIHRKQGLKERFIIMRQHFGWLPTIIAHIIILIKYPFTRKYH